MVILAGDHIYKMDYELMLQQHVDQAADVTVACLEVPRDLRVRLRRHRGGRQQSHRQLSWKSRPIRRACPDKPDFSLVSMGVYVLPHQVSCSSSSSRDAATPSSSRDFGKDMIPWLVANAKAVAHRFDNSCVRSSNEKTAYWRDVGTVDAYWEANIDLTDVVPAA